MPEPVIAEPGWKDAGHYAALAALPPEALAWEFLRRNSAFRAGTRPFAYWGLRFR